MRTTLVALLSLVAVGCKDDGKSLVVVNLSANAPLSGVAALSGHTTAGGSTVAFSIEPPGGALTFDPAMQSFGIDVPKGISGKIVVQVDAVDAQAHVLASGQGSATIKSGGRVDIALQLMVSGAPATDLGPPAGDLGPGPGGPDFGPPSDLAPPPTAALSADRSSQLFGSVTIGKQSNPVMIKVTNNGLLATDTLSFATSGSDVAQFSFDNGCSGTLASGSSCYVTVQFNPTSSGLKSAHFDVSATGTSAGVDVNGTGEMQGTLNISADAPYNGDCGSAVIGQTGSTHPTYTVTNVGGTDTGALAVSTGDPQFTATGCSGTLAPNSSCTITVSFKPSGAGSITSSVSVTATPGGTAPANVKGLGQNPASFSFTSSSGSFDFGSSTRNSAGTVLTITATNKGDVPSVPLTASTLGGSGAGSFVFGSNGDGCNGKQISPQQSCDVTLEFKPVVSGAIGATLQLNAASGVVGAVALTATGTPIWQQETVPVPSGATAVPAITVVFGQSGDGSHVYAAGGGYYFVRDATATWTAYSISVAGLTISSVSAGSAFGANSVYLATNGGLVKSTTPASWSASLEAAQPNTLDLFSGNDGWAAAGADSDGDGEDDSVQLYHLSSSSAGSWGSDALLTGSGAALWGTSDSDLWLGGSADLGGATTPVVWHRDSTGSWSQATVSAGCKICSGGRAPGVVGVWGAGTPATTAFAFTDPPNASAMYTSAGGWVAMPNLPSAMTLQSNIGRAVWGSSANDVWFASSNGVYRYAGNSTWDPNAVLTTGNFFSVWGSSGIDVYAVGQDPSSKQGVIYHYF